MGVRNLLPLLLLLSACATPRAQLVQRIALLAPFEGRYREVGYEALYAARLALQDTSYDGVNFELLPVDDGGTISSAAERARALAADPTVQAAIVLGHAAAAAETQQAFGDLSVIIIGHWGAYPQGDHVFILANQRIQEQLTVPATVSVTEVAQREAPLRCGEVCALVQFPQLRPDLSEITVVSSAVLPDAEFTTRYRGSDPFAPQPGLLAALTYDAAYIILQATEVNKGLRTVVQQTITSTVYQGLNGIIRFEAGYWLDAPIRLYTYDNNNLLKSQLYQSAGASCASLNLYQWLAMCDV